MNTVVVGLGKTGYSCVEYLCQRGQSVIVWDDNPSPKLLKKLTQSYPQVEFICGQNSVLPLSMVKQFIVSPGVELKKIQARLDPLGLKEWMGDIELFLQHASSPIIAVTGSNGKTTVVTLIGKMIQAAGFTVEVCGNIGEPVLSTLKRPNPDFIVMELSSFQLELINNLSATVAVLLNVEPDHMDRYQHFNDYLAAKKKIYMGCDHAVVNRDQAHYFNNIEPKISRLEFTVSRQASAMFSIKQRQDEAYLYCEQSSLMPVTEMRLQGQHHWQNALVLFAVAKALGLPDASVRSVLQSFEGLEHRCQLVNDYNGVRWFNDSKATNVAATCAAIYALSHQIKGRLILIMGGDAKGADFTPLKDLMTTHVDHVIFFGVDAEKIEAAFRNIVQLTAVDSLKEAVIHANCIATTNDTVALSPACSSLDMFDNFEHRGDLFARYVSGLK